MCTVCKRRGNYSIYNIILILYIMYVLVDGSVPGTGFVVYRVKRNQEIVE